MTAMTYPVHVDATLDPRISRWLWLVKWLLAIPHYIVLAFLWIAFVAVSIVAFFAILFTGRYPRALFDFNVGVLRWSWRVAYYTYGALGTDRYPPFTLAEVPDYPAHFEVDYPTHLSRGLVLVKWWLLAIPHYLVVGIFLGGGTWALWQTTDNTAAAPGLIGLLVFVAAVVLLFTGRYPQQIFDFVLGMNRWALRVAAYAGLMTDSYPPFRLDLGGSDPAGVMTVSSPPPPGPTAAATAGTPPGTVEQAATGTPPAAPGRRGWTAGRIVSLVIGAILGLIALSTLATASAATWATNTQRDAAGFITTGTHHYSTSTSALTSDTVDLGSAGDAITPANVLGTLRVRVSSVDPSHIVFVGVAPQAAAEQYLAGMDHAVVSDWTSEGTHDVLASGPVSTPRSPLTARIWTARTVGLGPQTLTWRPTSGSWVLVVMNADGSPGVSVNADAGATVPDLAWIAAGLFAAGIVLLAVGVTLIAVPAVRASR